MCVCVLVHACVAMVMWFLCYALPAKCIPALHSGSKHTVEGTNQHLIMLFYYSQLDKNALIVWTQQKPDHRPIAASVFDRNKRLVHIEPPRSLRSGRVNAKKPAPFCIY